MAKESKSSVSIPAFHKMLVLAQWALGIFNEVSFENISATLKHPSLEGIDENDGHTKFYHAIVNALFYMGDYMGDGRNARRTNLRRMTCGSSATGSRLRRSEMPKRGQPTNSSTTSG